MKRSSVRRVNSHLATVAFACLPTLLLLAPRVAAADEAPRRRGVDIEANLGIVDALCGRCEQVGLGRTVGGALLYRALPHLAFGIAGEALVFPFARDRRYPDLTVFSGVLGPTVRGYLRGRGVVDLYIGLTAGATFFSQSPPPPGTSTTGILGAEHTIGAAARLGERFWFTPSLAVTTLFAAQVGDLVYYPLAPPTAPVPRLSVSFRVGGTFSIRK